MDTSWSAGGREEIRDGERPRRRRTRLRGDEASRGGAHAGAEMRSGGCVALALTAAAADALAPQGRKKTGGGGGGGGSGAGGGGGVGGW